MSNNDNPRENTPNPLHTHRGKNVRTLPTFSGTPIKKKKKKKVVNCSGALNDYADTDGKFGRLLNDFKGTIWQKKGLGCDHIFNGNNFKC